MWKAGKIFKTIERRAKEFLLLAKKCKPKSKISIEEAKMYYEKYIELNSLNKTANFFQVDVSVVRKRIKIYRQALCEPCAKPLIEEGATTIRKE